MKENLKGTICNASHLFCLHHTVLKHWHPNLQLLVGYLGKYTLFQIFLGWLYFILFFGIQTLEVNEGQSPNSLHDLIQRKLETYCIVGLGYFQTERNDCINQYLVAWNGLPSVV